MTALLADFHFLRPWWLLLALAWLPLLAWRIRVARRGAVLGRLADAVLLPYLLVGTRPARWGGALLAFAAGALVTLALAGPAWQRLPQPLYAEGAAQVVVVSLSQRMLARDIKPDRMERVRFKVHDLLHANAAGRNGLVAYAGAAFTVAPLTTDAHALDDLLQALAPDVMPVAGDAPAAGIRRGAMLLRHAGVDGGSMVLVTDAVDAGAIAAARAAHARGIRISVLGVGTTHGVPVTLADGSLLTDASGDVVIARRDDASLRALAAAGGGVYVPMRDDHADVAALTAQLRTSHRTVASFSAQGNRWRDMGPWLLLPLLMIAAVSFRRGWLLLLPLVVLPAMAPVVRAAGTMPAPAGSVASAPAPPPVAAAPSSDTWAALWHNADQRAARALTDGQPRRAMTMARTPGLRGAAAYRAGDYAAAATAFAAAPGANAAYNRGNALARAGHYQQAIQAYDEALRQDARNADARANRKAVRDWLRRHRPPPREGQSGARSGKDQKAARQRSSSGRPGGKQGQGQAAPASSASSPASAATSARSSATQPRPASGASSAQSQSAHATSAPRPAAHDTGPDARAARQQSEAAQRAGRALERQLPRAAPSSGATFNLGAVPARASSIAPLPQSMQRALERVPDDPGGLLRRKFQLEYQQRQAGSSGGGA